MTTTPKPLLLIVDDIVENQLTISHAIEGQNYSLCFAQNGHTALEFIKHNTPDLVLLDLTLPDIPGEEILRIIKETNKEILVIIVTGDASPETIISCMKNNADDYLVKPIDPLRARLRVKKLLSEARDNTKLIKLEEKFITASIDTPESFSSIITQDSSMIQLFSRIEALASTNYPILITGETGTGKELIAAAIHHSSGRPGEYMTVNVGGLDDVFFSDTLFGHIKGAFTGAIATTSGVIDVAHNGTVFLDEIGELNDTMQVKLLRLLQNHEYTRLGETRTRQSSTRIIAATHKPLEQMVQDNRFREDLFHRLKPFHIHIPPLRYRTGDIPLLLTHFLSTIAREYDIKIPSYPPELITLLKNYSFSGNVREFEGMIRRILIEHKGGMLSLAHFKKLMGISNSKHERRGSFEEYLRRLPALPTLKEAPVMLINEALKRSDGNHRIAAEMLGVTRSALSQRLSKIDSTPQ